MDQDKIKAYRASSKSANRTADGTETVPTKFDRSDLLRMADAVNVALANNLPGAKTAAANLLTHILAEGRADAGTNGIDTNNKQSAELAKQLEQAGVNYKFPVSHYVSAADPANYVVVSAEKEAAAKRLGKPLAELWNGTGKSAMTGRTGAQHVNRFEQAASVVNSPKNAEIKSLLDRVISSGLTPAETFDVRRPEISSAIATNLPDAAYTAQWNTGAKGVQQSVKDVMRTLPSHQLKYYMPQLLTNIIGAPIGATPAQISGLAANTQTELEIALTSPRNKLLQGILP